MNPQRHNHRIRRFGRPRALRAFTLLEVLIAMAGSLVVVGVTLGIYDQSQQATLKIMARQEALETGRRALAAATRELNALVRPDALDNSQNLRATFKNDLVEAYRLGPSGGLRQVRLSTSGAGETLAIQRTDLERPGGDSPPAPIKFDETRIAAGLQFHYALKSNAGGPVDYVRELAPGEWPALIEIVYQARTIGPEPETITLRTAVTPGVISGGQP